MIGLIATGPHLIQIGLLFGILALPGCLTRAMRYRAAFDFLFLAADCCFVLGLTIQKWGENASPGLDGLARVFVTSFSFVATLALLLLAMVEMRYVRSGEVGLRLRELTRGDRFLYWCGFTALGRSPQLVLHERAQMKLPPGLKAELRRRRSSNFALGTVVVGLLLPGIWLCGFAVQPAAGGRSLAGPMLLGFFALASAAAYSYWLWRLSRKSRRSQPSHYYSMRCLNCGYDLRGLPERRCPECGVTF